MTGHIANGRHTNPRKQLTANQPQAGPVEVALSEYTVAAVRELLALTEEFLRTASPTVHAELRAYLDTKVPPADPAWFVDMLGFNATHLDRRLPVSAPTPRENWTRHPGAEIRDDKWGQNT